MKGIPRSFKDKGESKVKETEADGWGSLIETLVKSHWNGVDKDYYVVCASAFSFFFLISRPITLFVVV